MISSNDSVPSTLLAFNWLKNHTLHLDAFRGGYHYLPNAIFGENGIPYFFVEAPNGHLTSAYPIGTAIVSFPIYFLFFIYLKLSALLNLDSSNLSVLNITQASFEPQRQTFEKLAGAILTASANVMFYLLVKLKFSHAVAIVSTFIYAFATHNWIVSSQGLWAHTVSNFVLVSIMLCLFKANRAEKDWKQILLVLAGFFCGLLPGVRPPNLLFSLATVAYSGFVYRKQALFLLLGTLSATLNAIWNTYYFGFSLENLIVGGYSNLLGTSSGSYQFSLDYAKEAFPGLLISPSRGLLIFSPIVLFSIPGIRRVFERRADQDEKLLLSLSIACLCLFIQYCFFLPWWGAITYGSRFLTDILPVVCYLISYFLAEQLDSFDTRRNALTRVTLVAFLACFIFSTSTQIVGAFSDPHVWDTAPLFDRSRFWQWQDSQIERHARNLLFKIQKPIQNPQAYLQELSGVIEGVKREHDQRDRAVIVANPSELVVLEAKLKNTGQSKWFGYDTGTIFGRAVVRVRFYRRNGKEVSVVQPSLLFVKGAPQQGENATAVGSIWFPQKPGNYRMTFNLESELIGDFPTNLQQTAYELRARVKKPQ
jgi:hypothetical protein